MSLVCEVSAVVVAVAYPLEQNAHVGGVANGAVFVFIAGVRAPLFVLRLRAVREVVATLL